MALGPRLSSTARFGFADRFEEPIVLHVAAHDLQHVGVVGHEPDIFRREHFGDDRQARGFASLRQQLQPFFFQALEAVGWYAVCKHHRAGAPSPPAAFTPWAALRSCSSFSTEQGPAMTPICLPPTDRLPAVMTDVSFFTSRLAILYGGEDRQHLGDAGPSLKHSFKPSRSGPTAAMTVRIDAVQTASAARRRYDQADQFLQVGVGDLGEHDDDHGLFLQRKVASSW